MAHIITEFLASVGFQADETSLRTAMGRVAAFGAAVKAAAAAVSAAVISVAQEEVRIAYQADMLGTTTEKLRGLNFAAEQAGLGTEELAQAMERFVETNPGVEDAVDGLIRVSREMEGMSIAQRRLYAESKGIEPKLVPLLSADLSGVTAQFRELYAAAGPGAANAAESARGLAAEMGKLRVIGQVLVRAVASRFMGRIRDSIQRVRVFIVENFDKIRAALDAVTAFFFRVSDTVDILLSRIIGWGGALISWYGKLDEGQKKVILGLGLLLAAWKLLNLGFLATPLGMIISGLLALGLLIDDYLTYMRGGESYFGEKWEEWSWVMEGLISVIKPLAGIILAAAAAVKIWTAVTAAFNAVAALNPVVLIVMAVLAAIGLVVYAAVKLVKHWGKVRAFFADLWKGIAEGVQHLAGKITAFFARVRHGLTKGAKDAADKIRAFFGPLIRAFSRIGKMFKALFTGDFKEAAKYAEQAFQALAGFAVRIFSGLARALFGIFKNLWKKIREKFPNFAAWAERSAAAVRDFFAPVLEWLEKTLGKIISGAAWAGKKLGLIEDDPEAAARIVGRGMDSLHQAAGIVMAAAGKNAREPALAPGPAEAAAILTNQQVVNHTKNSGNNTTLNARTTIHVTAPDPVSAGRQVADRQNRVNADTARNLKGAVK